MKGKQLPESFILALILFGLAAIAVPFLLKKNIRFVIGMSIIALVLLGGLFTANASFNTVPVRNTGIVTAYHKPVADDPNTKDNESVTGAGATWVKPWLKVEEWDANYELWDHRSDNKDDNHKNGKGMLVKIAGNQDAWVPVSVEYSPDPNNASKDFVDYARDRNKWIERRVHPTLEGLVTNLFRKHDPLAVANVDPVTGQVSPPDMKPYKDELNTQLKGEAVEFRIRNLYIGTIVYNDKTTTALQKYADLVLENRNLGQEKKNQTLKNDITLSQSKVDSLTYCLQIAEKNGVPCLIGSSNVIVDATPKK